MKYLKYKIAGFHLVTSYIFLNSFLIKQTFNYLESVRAKVTKIKFSKPPKT